MSKEKIIVGGACSAASEIETALKKIDGAHAGKAGPFALLALAWVDVGSDGARDVLQARSEGAPLVALTSGAIDNAPSTVACIPPRAAVVFKASNLVVCVYNAVAAEKEDGIEVLSTEACACARGEIERVFGAGAFVEAVQEPVAASSTGRGGFDVLITSALPLDVITRNIPDHGEVARYTCPKVQSLVTALAEHGVPQYHYGIAGVPAAHAEPAPFFERVPYITMPAGGNGIPWITRVLALSHCGNTEKKKWIHATAVLPRAVAVDDAAIPKGTPSPYERSVGELVGRSRERSPEPVTERKRQKVEGDGEAVKLDAAYSQFGSVQYGNPSARSAGYAQQQEQLFRGGRRGGKRGGRRGRGQQQLVIGAGKCWFCLESPDVEAHLVVSVGDHAYLALAKGGLVPRHVLIIPVEHLTCATTVPAETHAEIKQYKDALRKAAQRKGEDIVLFERNVQTKFGAVHAHVQCVPLPSATVAKCGGLFKAEAQRLGLELVELTASETVQQYAYGGQYFLVELPGNVRLLFLVSSGRFPLQFGRLVIAHAMGQDERADWKECIVSREEEDKLAEDFKAEFRPFDFT